jgi:hypothetical protein
MPQPVPNAVNNTFNHPAGGAGAHVHVPATPSIVTPATPASIPVTPSNPVTPAMPSIARPATPGAATVVTPTTPRPSVGTVIMPGGAVVEPRIPSTPNAGAGAVVTPPRIPSTPSAGGASNTATPSVPSAGAGTVAPSVPSTPSIGVSPAAGTIAPSAPAAGSSIPATPVNPASPVNPATPASPSPVPAPDLVPHSNVGSGVVGAHGKEIINFQAAKATWGCHWFPLQESKVGGDHINNLYAVGGCLDKLDALTGGSARQYEFEHNRKPFGSGQQYSWWGHCNNASEAACILRAPQHDVVMKGANGNEVRFTKNDIQGLLVKVAPSLVNGVDFKGERYNGTRDNPQDPKPELFLQVMKEWTKDGLPFVLDIDNREQVWNFPYDKVKIYESDRAPQGFSGSIEGEGTVTYYHIEMAGTGFDKKARIYECYIQKNSSGAVVSSAWIKTGNTHNNPDFMWRPHPVGDITDKSVWKLKSKPSNPQVDPQVVYDIYMKSLA